MRVGSPDRLGVPHMPGSIRHGAPDGLHIKNTGEPYMNQQTRKWKRDFFIIWSGQGISTLTSSIVQMAIIWYITSKTESAAVLSFATLIGFLPQAVLGMFIGVLIDRYNRKKIMIISDLSMSAACGLLAIVGIWGDIPIWLIMVVLFARSIGSAFFSPSLQAVMPLIIPKDQLTKYAGYSQTFESASMIASPALAAVLYSLFPLNKIIVLDVLGACFAVSTLMMVKIPRISPDTETKEPNLLREARDGYMAIRRVRGMRELLIIGAMYAVIYFPIGTLYPLITMTYFNGGVKESGFVEAVFSVGTLIGSLMLGVWGGKIHKIKAIILSIGVYGAGCLMTGFLPPEGFMIFVVLSFFMGASVPFYFGVQTSIFQIKISGEYLGRVLSLTSSISMLAMPMGLILSGAFAGMMGINRWFLLSGAVTLMIAGFAAVLPGLRDSLDG